MANKRMFSKQITGSDAFIDMPTSSQLLYFHLNMEADDDGFVGNPKKITRMIGANDDDLKVLLAKRFVLTFESGVIVIKHWKLHNTIATDRYHETQYLEEKKGLITKDNKVYTECIQNVDRMETQTRLDKVRLDKVRLDKVRERTPSEIAKSFFEGKEYYESIKLEFGEKVAEPFLSKEFEKFILYWTEPNKSGTKVRWELQPTFDVKRRLVNWFGNIKNNNRSPASKGRGIA